MRVLAAMSGGVDSAVAAARAVDAGHDVTGVHLALSRRPATLREGARGCCTVEDAHDARRAADVIGIPFYVWDFSADFDAAVVADFVDEYARGHTPNPCMRCNERVKFAALLDRAVHLGFDAVCTGHYAAVREGALWRGADAAKDQSYVLARLCREQLARALFPLAPSSKAQVRAEAASRGLALAGKADSHDVCFVPDGDTAGFLRARLGPAPGPVVDASSGAVLGAHGGAYSYTVGQRRGLRLGRPAPDGRPRYVLGLSPATRTVLVGTAEDLDVDALTAEAAYWHDGPPERAVRCLAQLRAHGAPHAVTAAADGDRLSVTFDAPPRGVSPGQAVVLYDGDRVLAAATVAGTTRRAGRTAVRSVG